MSSDADKKRALFVTNVGAGVNLGLSAAKVKAAACHSFYTHSLMPCVPSSPPPQAIAGYLSSSPALIAGATLHYLV